MRCEYYDTLDMDAPYRKRTSKPTFAGMYRDRRYKLCVYHGLEYGQLYDLEEDPEQFHNLWDGPTAQGLKLDLMKRAFDAAIQATDIGPPLIGRY